MAIISTAHNLFGDSQQLLVGHVCNGEFIIQSLTDSLASTHSQAPNQPLKAPRRSPESRRSDHIKRELAELPPNVNLLAFLGNDGKTVAQLVCPLDHQGSDRIHAGAHTRHNQMNCSNKGVRLAPICLHCLHLQILSFYLALVKVGSHAAFILRCMSRLHR